MKINKENYEIYFLDYFEHALDPGQVADLMVFLEANPDLNDEFESFESLKIVPETFSFQKKKSLRKRNYSSTGLINPFNYEHFMVAGIENDLTKQESDELKEFFNLNPDARLEYELFKKVRLVPENLNFQNKTGLKHRPIPLLYRRESWVMLAVAASILIFLAIYVQNKNQDVTPDITDKDFIPVTESPEQRLPDPADVAEVDTGTGFEIREVSGSGPGQPNRQVDSGGEISTLNPVKSTPVSIRHGHHQTLPLSIAYRELYSPAMMESNHFVQQSGQPSFASRFVRGAFNNLFQTRERSKKSFLEYTVNSYNLIADREVEVEKEYDATGRIIAYHVNGELIKIGRRVDPPMQD